MTSSEFDIENTYLQDIERLEKLLCLVMIAFIWCYKVGDYIDRFAKPIQIKKPSQRAKSVFKHCLESISNILLNSNNEKFQFLLPKIVM